MYSMWYDVSLAMPRGRGVHEAAGIQISRHMDSPNEQMQNCVAPKTFGKLSSMNIKTNVRQI